MAERLVAALGVPHHAPLQVLGRGAPQDAEVQAPEVLEVVQGGGEIALLVGQALRPEVLVIPGQLGGKLLANWDMVPPRMSADSTLASNEEAPLSPTSRSIPSSGPQRFRTSIVAVAWFEDTSPSWAT